MDKLVHDVTWALSSILLINEWKLIRNLRNKGGVGAMLEELSHVDVLVLLLIEIYVNGC